MRQLPVLGRLRNASQNLGHIARLVLGGKLDLLPRRDDGVKPHRHPLRLHIFIGSAGSLQQSGAALLGAADAEHLRADLSLIIPLSKALAGEDRPQRLSALLTDLSLVYRRAVDAGHGGHVFRPLHASLQLDAGNAHDLQLAQIVDQAIILQAQRVFFLKPVKAVGQTAGLGALAPVSAPAADDRRHIALPGMAHTQRAVDKHLDLHRAVAADKVNVFFGQFPGQDHPGDPHSRSLLHALERVDAHLGRGVHRHRRRDLAAQGDDTEVLDDKGVHARTGCRLDRLGRGPHLPVGNQGVQRQIDLDAPHMAVAHRLRQLVQCEVFSAPTGIKILGAKVDRVGSVAHGGAERVERTGGRKQLKHETNLYRIRNVMI